ncbi:MAG: hypothetical protein J5525_12435 [Lachnospiraceae bacterium]|nr:hypothetical protein [Lachnospiraceae bacterium]
MQRYATNIKWDVEDEDVYGRCESCKNYSRCGICSDCNEGSEYEADYDAFNLPSEVKIPANIEDDDITDYLSDEYDFCVESFEIEER